MRSLLGCAIGFVLLLVQPHPAFGLFDNGGKVSREAAVGDVERDVGDIEEMVYYTWQGVGSTNNLRLYAFCADGVCQADTANYTPPSCANPPTQPADLLLTDCADNEPCKWRIEFTDSDSDENSFAPPVAYGSGSDRRVYVALKEDAGGGRIYAFDPCGNYRWDYDPAAADSTGGFYSRPVVHPMPGGKSLILAVNWRKPLNLHVIHGEGYATPGSVLSTSFPYEFDVEADAFFEPLLDTECPTLGDLPRVFVGVTSGGSSKRKLYAIALGDEVSPSPTHTSRQDSKTNFKMGGTFATTSGGTRYLVAPLDEGQKAAAVQVDCSTSFPPVDDEQDEDLKKVHRGRPIEADGVIYILQKEGGPNGTGVLHRYQPELNVGSVFTGNDSHWPTCHPGFPGSGKLAHSSWVSPIVNSLTDHIYIGTNQNSGIHRVPEDPCAAGVSLDDTLWFDHRPTEGWRSTAAFSDGGAMLHYASTQDLVYSLRTEPDGCGVVEWCYQMSTHATDPGDGWRCTYNATGDPPCCSDVHSTLCLDVRLTHPTEVQGWVDDNPADGIRQVEEITTAQYNEVEERWELLLVGADEDEARYNTHWASGPATWISCHSTCTGSCSGAPACSVAGEGCCASGSLYQLFGWLSYDGTNFHPTPLREGVNSIELTIEDSGFGTEFRTTRFEVVVPTPTPTP